MLRTPEDIDGVASYFYAFLAFHHKPFHKLKSDLRSAPKDSKKKLLDPHLQNICKVLILLRGKIIHCAVRIGDFKNPKSENRLHSKFVPRQEHGINIINNKVLIEMPEMEIRTIPCSRMQFN